jgi:hypothetical protein
VPANSPTTCSSSSTRSGCGRRERLPEPRRFRPNCSARPQDLSPRFAGAGSAISNALFSSGFRYSRPRPPRGGPPYGGGALSDRTSSRFAGIFHCRLDRPAIRLASPSLIKRDSIVLKPADLQVFKALSRTRTGDRLLTMELFGQAVATHGNDLRLFPRFSRMRDLRPIATGCNHGAP